MPTPITIGFIQAVTAAHFKLPPGVLWAQNRQRRYAKPRLVAYWLCRHLTDRSFPEIGRSFKRNHSTILDGVAAIDRLIGQDDWYGQEAKALEYAIRKHCSPETVA